MNKKQLVILVWMFVACKSYAAWYVGTRNPPDVVTSSGVSLSYINPTASITIPAFSGYGMYIANSGLCGDHTTPHYTWTFVSMPARERFTNLSYIEFTGVGDYTEVGELEGQRRYYQQTVRNWSWGITCGDYTPGMTTPTDTWSRPAMLVTARLVDGGDITPGYHRIEVPLRVAQAASTNNPASVNAALSWADANVHKLSYVSTYWIIEATITPKCWTSSNDIELSHGSIDASQVNGHMSEQKTLLISCNTPTVVSVEIIPVIPSPSYGKSATKCGDKLVCVPTIDGKTDKQTYSAVSAISIKLQDQLAMTDNTVDPGAFSGNSVLRVLYQ